MSYEIWQVEQFVCHDENDLEYLQGSIADTE
jgi:hypothetical protein